MDTKQLVPVLILSCLFGIVFSFASFKEKEGEDFEDESVISFARFAEKVGEDFKDKSVLSFARIGEKEGEDFEDKSVKDEIPCGQDCGPDDNVISKKPPMNENGTNSQDLHCPWTVTAPPDHVILVVADLFDVEPGPDCVFNHLELQDGVDNQEVIRFCGVGPFKYLTKTKQLRITFVSDGSWEGSGFRIDVTYIKENGPLQCLTKMNGSEVVLRNSDTGNCFYRIDAPEGHEMHVKVRHLDFGTNQCDRERLYIYKGDNSQSKSLKLCSNSTSADLDTEVISRRLLFEYTGTPMSGNRFELLITQSDVASTKTQTETTTTSVIGVNSDSNCSLFVDNLIDDYEYVSPKNENSRECVVTFRNTAKPGHVIQVTFSSFSLQEAENCPFDFLNVYAGENQYSPRLGGPYCGHELNGRTLVTNGNSLRLHYISDASVPSPGFTALVKVVTKTDCECGTPADICVRKAFEKLCVPGHKCDVNKCQNGGTCVMNMAPFSCFCADGFCGDLCDQVVGGPRYFGFEKVPRSSFYSETMDNWIHMECKADVKGHVTYNWTVNGQPIGPYNRMAGIGYRGEAGQGSVLQIRRFSKALEGLYTCNASTEYGHAEHVFFMLLETACDKDQLRSMTGPGDLVIDPGSDVQLACQTDPPDVHITWLKDGRPIDPQTNPRFKVLLIGHLVTLSDVTLIDAGHYTCRTASEFICATERSGYLTIKEAWSQNVFCGVTREEVEEEAEVHGLISQGWTAARKQFPWHVNLVNMDDSWPFCGGSLISRKYVLTAAHCFKNPKTMKTVYSAENVKLRLGTNECLSDDGAVLRRVKTVHLHPDFHHKWEYNNDIALLELEEPIDSTFQGRVFPICLERQGFTDQRFLHRTSGSSRVYGTAAGCGQKFNQMLTELLQYVDLPLVDNYSCKKDYPTVTEAEFCAGYKIKNKGDVCTGDTGGSLVMSDGTRWVQTGIVSFGARHGLASCDNRFYSGFTNVGHFYDWIVNITDFTAEQNRLYLE